MDFSRLRRLHYEYHSCNVGTAAQLLDFRNARTDCEAGIAVATVTVLL